MFADCSTVTSDEFCKPLPTIGLERLIAGDSLTEEQTFQAIDQRNAFLDESLAFPAVAAPIFLVRRGHDYHRADARITALERQQRAQERLPAEPIGLGSPTSTRCRNRRRIDNVAVNPFTMENAVNPKAVETSLLDRHEREHPSSFRLRS